MMLADGRFCDVAMYDGYVIINEEGYDVVIAVAPIVPLVVTNHL